MNQIKPISRTKDTVTLKLADYEAILDTLEDTRDRRFLSERVADEARRGKGVARADYLPVELVKRCIDGESRVRIWREHRGLTQAQLAEKATALDASVGKSLLSQIEAGTKAGSIATMRALASVLSVAVDELLGPNRTEGNSAVPNVSPPWLFKVAGLRVEQFVRWKNISPTMDERAGVYVVTWGKDLPANARRDALLRLNSYERRFWLDDQDVLYIGQTEGSIGKRLMQFKRQNYLPLGSPPRGSHRGGKAIKLLNEHHLMILWAATEKPQEAEGKMLDAFEGRVGRLPFANRKRSNLGR